MSDHFVETGQTFTDDGAAYCPVEERRRGAIGVTLSLVILAAGTGFLAYAMMGSAAIKRAPSPDQQIPVEKHVIAKAKPTEVPAMPLASSAEPPVAQQTEITNPPPLAKAAISATLANAATDVVAEPENPSALKATSPDIIAAAIAESRAARGLDKEYVFTAPTIKPTRQSAAISDVALSMRPTPVRPRTSSTSKIEASPDNRSLRIVSDKRPNALAVFETSDLLRDAIKTTVTISKGETFVDALKRAGVSARDRNLSAIAFGKHYNMRRLKPGQEFNLTLGWPNQTLFQLASEGEPQTRLLNLEFRNGFENIITVKRNQQGDFNAGEREIERSSALHAIAGQIEGSLYLSAKAQGAPDNVIASLADAFAYDVDFQREIFRGDEYEVLFEAEYDDRGVMIPGGKILFARLNWRGQRREKGYYNFNAESYGGMDFYDETGQSAKRLLMKTPIDGARLSSGFGRRKHPILGYAKAHKGVDFAAPRGTPIKAAGDGVVERADRYGSFGNYIRIRHANGYKTAYAHLKGFRKGVRKGKRVRQGDIIGYVGTTGRSTGPHLHYEVHLNGKAVNPQKLKIATGKKLTGGDLERFKLERERIDLIRQAAKAPTHNTTLASDENNGSESL